MEPVKEPWTCIFCSRVFSRSDALKRHWSSCGRRKACGLPVPAFKVKARGRKLRACDQCYQSKRACTSLQPCKPCALRGYVCSYSRLQARGPIQEGPGIVPIYDGSPLDSDLYDSVFRHINEDTIDINGEAATSVDTSVYGSVSSTTQDTGDSSEPSSVIPRSAADSNQCSSTNELDVPCALSNWDVSDSLMIEHGTMAPIYQRPTHFDVNTLIKFPFLNNLTMVTGFVNSFECGTRQQRLAVASNPVRAHPPRKISALSGGQSNSSAHWVDMTRTALLQQDESVAESVALLDMTHTIVSQIREITITRQRHSPAGLAWSPAVEALCYNFFEPTSLQKNLALFWSFWYPNWPTIHRPTFEVTEKLPGLIAVMALVGACLSPEYRDHASAQVWFDPVEGVIFSNDTFNDHDNFSTWKTQIAKERRKRHIDVLQAAYCVCLYQTWEGSRQSKRRAMRQRFNSLVFLARDIGLIEASLQCIDTSNPAAFDWGEYILRESLIRMCSYICNIDASYALFFRHVPRMALSELVFEMSSPEGCFNASCKEECFVELKVWRSKMGVVATKKNLTILDAVHALRNSVVMSTPPVRRAFSHLSVLNMFTIIHALYSQVNRLETSAIATADSTEALLISEALRHWKESWPSGTRDAELADLIRKEKGVSTMWQRVGFMKYAPEYWLLTRLTLETISKRSPVEAARMSDRTVGVEDCDMIEAQKSIARFRHRNPMSLLESSVN